MKSHDELLDGLLENAARFVRAANGAPEPYISERPSEEKWSVKEVLCHLPDIQRLGLGRIRQMLAEEHPAIELYDEVKENRERDHSRDNLERQVVQFLLDRLSLVRTLGRLAQTDWKRAGRHPARKDFTIEFIVDDMLNHEARHFEQMPRAAASELGDHSPYA